MVRNRLAKIFCSALDELHKLNVWHPADEDNHVDSDGPMQPCSACLQFYIIVFTSLLDAGAKINDPNQNDHWGTTPLHAAAHGNQKKVVELLISRGADVNAHDLNDRTPIGETVFHNCTAIAKLLKAAGAQSE